MADDKIDVFYEGDFGKERRVRLNETSAADACRDVRRVLRAAVRVQVRRRSQGLGHLADRAGHAALRSTRSTAGNSSLFAEVEFNKWSERKRYFGFNVGVWDFGHSHLVAPTAGIQFGTRLWSAGADGNELHFVGSGRLFLNKLDDIANNYQFWGGVRYIFR